MNLFKKNGKEASKMTQRVKALVKNSDNFSPVFATHLLETKKQFLKLVLCFPYLCIT